MFREEEKAVKKKPQNREVCDEEVTMELTMETRGDISRKVG